MISKLTDEQQTLLMKGALFSVKTSRRDVTVARLKDIALWMILERKNGDDDFAFFIALTIPSACQYIEEQEYRVSLFKDEYVDRVLTSIRTSFFIKASRSVQLNVDVV